MLSIENSIELAAPPWRVWAALTKLDAYARWHPYVTAAGTPEVGRDVDYSMRSRILRRPITAPATVTCLSEPEAFAWRVGVGGLLRFDESFHIEASEHGATLRHVMECRGVLTRVIPGLDRRLRDFVGGEPLCIGSVGSGVQLSGNPVAQEIDQHVVIDDLAFHAHGYRNCLHVSNSLGSEHWQRPARTKELLLGDGDNIV